MLHVLGSSLLIRRLTPFNGPTSARGLRMACGGTVSRLFVNDLTITIYEVK